MPAEAPADQPLTIGVLALQGAYDAHARTLTALGAIPRLVRTPAELDGPEGAIDGLIMPGGESTTMLKFLEKQRILLDPRQVCRRQRPPSPPAPAASCWRARSQHPPQRSAWALLDATVERNAYGRQIDSTILTAPTELPGGPLEMVFIRAPRIRTAGPGVEVLATRDGFPILVRQDNSSPPPSTLS